LVGTDKASRTRPVHNSNIREYRNFVSSVAFVEWLGLEDAEDIAYQVFAIVCSMAAMSAKKAQYEHRVRGEISISKVV
jgi:hypothetical protein